MLLRFRVANVRSLRDEQELSFVAPEDAGAELAAARETLLSDGRRLSVHTVLGVFGANASGKSNVVAALKKMRLAVLPGVSLRKDYFSAATRLRGRSSPWGSGEAPRLQMMEIGRLRTLSRALMDELLEGRVHHPL